MHRTLTDLTSDLRALEESMAGGMDSRKLLKLLQRAFEEIDRRLGELEASAKDRQQPWPPASEEPTDWIWLGASACENVGRRPCLQCLI